jgi:hypothetical protein
LQVLLWSVALADVLAVTMGWGWGEEYEDEVGIK